MKFLLTILFLISNYVAAQEETLIETGEIEHGGYGAVSVSFTQVKNEFAVMAGGYGGWLINHTFLIGGGGFGLANAVKADKVVQTDPDKSLYIKMGYGGLILEYINSGQKLIHYNIQTLIGGGGVYYALSNQFDLNNHKNYPFFVLEIGGNAELNVVQFFRINLGAKYRFVSGVDIEGLNNSDLSGPNVQLIFKFGVF